jgi:ABC-type glycerol-3-phosphate transport system substrate-binding protein
MATLISRRAAIGSTLAGSAVALAAPSIAQTRERVARVWGEPGPYVGVFTNGLNEWAQRNAPGLRFEAEQIPWDQVYTKLATDLAARRPPALISVESPIAYQLAAEGLLEPMAEVNRNIRAAERLVPGFTIDDFGTWKGTQYAVPLHHQGCLLVVQSDAVQEAGLSDPSTWTWQDLLNGARAIQQRRPGTAGYTMALGRNLCGDYHVQQYIWAAGGLTWDPGRNFETVFNSPATIEAYEFIKELYSTMPRSAVEFSFLQVVDQHVAGRTGMSAYWGRTMGRAADEAQPIFRNMEYYLNPKHPGTGRSWSWTDINGWIMPARNNPFVREGKEAIAHVMNNTEWMARYTNSLFPNVGPVFKDTVADAAVQRHPLYDAKRRSVDLIFSGYVPHACNSGHELKRGINPLAGLGHGRNVWSQVAQRILVNNEAPRAAVEWGHRQFEDIRRENRRLIE